MSVGKGDPHAEERAENNFMDALTRAHGEAGWALEEMRGLYFVHRAGVRTDLLRPRSERLRRIASRFRAALRHIEDAETKSERLP